MEKLPSYDIPPGDTSTIDPLNTTGSAKPHGPGDLLLKRDIPNDRAAYSVFATGEEI
jgi:hypothetical protein